MRGRSRRWVFDFFGRNWSDLLGLGRNAPAHPRECETTKGARESRELARINSDLKCVTAVIDKDDGGYNDGCQMQNAEFGTGNGGTERIMATRRHEKARGTSCSN